MRTYLIRPILATALFLALAASALAQPGLVRGKVVDSNKQPVQDATVTFEGQAGLTAKRQAKTDSRGDFLLVGVDSGQYKVTASKDGVGIDTITVTLQQGQNPALTFTLSPAAATTAGGAGAAAPGAAAGTDAKAAAALNALARGGVEHLNAGRNDEAIAAFTEVTSKSPKCSDCFVNLGIAHSNKKEYEQAEKAFKDALAIKPDNADAYDRLAVIYNAQRKFDLAAEASANAAKYSAASAGAAGGGGNAGSLFNQGVALFNGGKFAEAKTAFEAATKADPKNAMAHYQLGMTALNLGDYALAVSSLETYLQLDPSGPKAAEVKASLPALKGMVKK
jgi:Flp pilus assembly protein TadD